MIFEIRNWLGGGGPPVPEARAAIFASRRVDDGPFEGYEGWAVEIDDLLAFAEKHGQIRLMRPTKRVLHWFIWITDKDHADSMNGFGQR